MPDKRTSEVRYDEFLKFVNAGNGDGAQAPPPPPPLVAADDSPTPLAQCPYHAANKLSNLSIKDEEEASEFDIEQLETGDKTTVKLAEADGRDVPRHTVGCTPYECHGALMEKNGFGAIGDSYAPGKKICLEEAIAFLTQYAHENEGAYDAGRGLEKRLAQVKEEIDASGSYVQTFDELQYGCRLAWRNSGRCIMRKVSFTLELRDSREITTAEDMYYDVLEHFKYAANGGCIKPVISVYPPKRDGESAPVRIWNAQLIGYAAYKRSDGTIMGDPARLEFTAIAVKYGWVPPEDEDKSDFDLLPLVISDETTGHDKPMVFPLTSDDIVLEVPLDHPEHLAFSDLNLRWYALPAISNIGIDVGGVYYQTCPFNGWYAATEIGRDILDKQRYDMANAVSIACGIPRTTLAVWKDDVQLQVHRAILHSFAKHSISIVDHHTASNSFQEFFQDEIKQRGKCPADWVWLVPPAGGSMTSVFHQEMFNYIQKPQYRPNVDVWKDLNISVPVHVNVDTTIGAQDVAPFSKEACIYDKIIVAYGSETGTSLKYANIIAGSLQVHPIPLDDVPATMSKMTSSEKNLLLVVTSTFGKGCPPRAATNFIPGMDKLEKQMCDVDFAVLALGNSAYVTTFVNFALEVGGALKKAGCMQALPMNVADELKNQDESFEAWEYSLYGNSSGIVYQKNDANEESFELKNNAGQEKMVLSYAGTASLTKDPETLAREIVVRRQESCDSYAKQSGVLIRSTDLFSFKAKDSDVQSFLHYGGIEPGDHIALYPKNQEDEVEIAQRLLRIDDHAKFDEYHQTLLKNVDMGRPLSLSSIQTLCESCTHTKGKAVLNQIISNTNDADMNSNSPTLFMLINRMPPGSVPIEWVLDHAPGMMPRFFSISSINGDEVTITQSVYEFAYSKQAGTTSKYLRLSLNPGDDVEMMFSTTDFHLPENESAPVIMIAAGSGIAPFRSFWMAKKKNPMHLFFGTQKECDVPFKTELCQLKDSGRLNLHTAYSRGENAQYIQDKLFQEASTIKELLTNPETTIYVCGTPEMEYAIRERLVKIIGGGIANATMALCRMKVQGTYVAEVYGKATAAAASSPMSELWDECLSKTVYQASSLDRIGVPKPRVEKKVHRTHVSFLKPSRRSSRKRTTRLTVMPVTCRHKSVWAL